MTSGGGSLLVPVSLFADMLVVDCQSVGWLDKAVLWERGEVLIVIVLCEVCFLS